MTQIRKEELTPQEEKYLIEYNIKFSKTRSEFDEDKENRELSRQLNKTAFCIITALVVIVLSHFIYLLINKTDISFSEGVMSINSDIEQINFQNNNIDNQTITLILKKLKEVEKSIIQKEEIFKDDARFLIVVVGSIFAVVGFFGFKSIFDTRQAAVEKAITEAKESAKTKANEVANEVANKTAKETAKETAKNLIPDITNTYLNREIPIELKRLESSSISELRDKISELRESVDKLNDAYSFQEQARPNTIIIIEEKFKKIVTKINELEEKQLREIIIEQLRKTNTNDYK